MKVSRTPYQECPLCEGKYFSPYLRAPATQHPLWNEKFETEMVWVKCSLCGHVFTEGYFEGESLDVLLEEENVFPHTLEAQRMLCAKMVERATMFDEDHTWLDVGCGSGGLVMTAQEYGFRAEGIDLRESAVKRCNALGLRAFKSTLQEHAQAGPFDVVSLCDVLEHVPFPREMVRDARKALSPGGSLVVSCPNLDTFHMLPPEENPYWWELEHFHNFSRGRLITLLEQEGFEDFRYHVSERYRLGMEIYCEAWRQIPQIAKASLPSKK